MRSAKSFLVLIITLSLIGEFVLAGNEPVYNPFHSSHIVFNYPDDNGKISVSIIIPDSEQLRDYLVDKSIDDFAQIGMAGPNGWGADSTDIQDIIEWSNYSDFRLMTSFESWRPDHFRGTPFIIDKNGKVSYLSISRFTCWFGANNTIMRAEDGGHIIDFTLSDYIVAEAPVVITEPSENGSITVEVGTDLSWSATARGTLPIYMVWLHNGIVVSGRAMYSGVGIDNVTSTFDIQAVDKEDEGKWICSFINLYGRATTKPITVTTVVDSDSDGLIDAEEVVLGTNPNNPDSDDDGLNDGDEIVSGTDPLDPDSDNDGLIDGKEVIWGTDPLNPDSDGNGILDGNEFLDFDAGWNNFAVPFTIDVATFLSDTDKVMLPIWRWENGTYCSVTILEPLKGYWAYALEDCQLFAVDKKPR